MEKEIKALAAYLELEEELISPSDDNQYWDTENDETYYVFTDKDLLDYVRKVLPLEVTETAKEDLYFKTRHSSYSQYFIVDEYMIEEDCMSNTEELLGTDPREVFEFEGETFIILKVQ